jgi:diguanylate cyclase (GGDEF)-like protein
MSRKAIARTMIAPIRASSAAPHVLKTLMARAIPAWLFGDSADLNPEVHAELVGYLFATLWQHVIVSLGYVGLSFIAYRASRDPLIGGIGIVGASIALARILLVLRYRRLPAEARRCRDVIAVWEQRYALGSYLFAACVGIMELQLFLHVPHAVPLSVALLYAYGAGLTARVCLRPRIAVGSLLIATLPALCGMALRGSFENLSLLCFTVVFFIGGYETVLHTYRSLIASLTMRFEFRTLAQYDALTGLSNRLQTRERLSDELARIARHGGLIAVHYLDLDYFKLANDRFGHSVGDSVLKQVAQRLQQLVRQGDIVGRLGGDEFLIVQTGISHCSEAEVLAMRIIRAIGQPFEIQGKEIKIGTSIGIAFAPTDSTDMPTLIKYADAALYAAKARARSSYVFHKDRATEIATETAAHNAGSMTA